MAKAESNVSDGLTLELVRDSLIRQEDTIVFSLIERARFPLNSPTYDPSHASIPRFCGSLVEFIVKQTEAIQARAGRYENPEEHPFFPDNLPPSLVPHHKYPKVLHPAAMSVNINKLKRDMYFNKLLPKFVTTGDDGNYASTAARDLECLQDKDALMNLLEFKDVEEEVKNRVAKKAMTFGEEVKLGDDGNKGKYKVDPAIVSSLYGDWVIPLTREVEVEYLLHRLD